MSDTLAKAFEQARKLPEKEQEALGAILLDEIRSERRWGKLFRSSQDKLGELADQAPAEHYARATSQWRC